MKKLCAYVMLILGFLFLLGCSSDIGTVPDTLVCRSIDDEFGDEAYEYSIQHDVDQELRIDYVTVSVSIPQKYGNRNYFASGAYQYIKSDDIWETTEALYWDDGQNEFIEDRFIQAFDGEFEDGPYVCDYMGTYYFEIQDIDFEDMEITGDFYLSGTIFHHGWSDNVETSIAYYGSLPLTMDYYDGYSFILRNDNCYAECSLKINSGIIVEGLYD